MSKFSNILGSIGRVLFTAALQGDIPIKGIENIGKYLPPIYNPYGPYMPQPTVPHWNDQMHQQAPGQNPYQYQYPQLPQNPYTPSPSTKIEYTDWVLTTQFQNGKLVSLKQREKQTYTLVQTPYGLQWQLIHSEPEIDQSSIKPLNYESAKVVSNPGGTQTHTLKMSELPSQTHFYDGQVNLTSGYTPIKRPAETGTYQKDVSEREADVNTETSDTQSGTLPENNA